MNAYNPYSGVKTNVGLKGPFVLNNLEERKVILVQSMRDFIDEHVRSGQPLTAEEVSLKFNISHYRVCSLFVWEYIDHSHIFPSSKPWLALAKAFKEKYPEAGTRGWNEFIRRMPKNDRFRLIQATSTYLSGEAQDPPMFLREADLARFMTRIPMLPQSRLASIGSGKLYASALLAGGTGVPPPRRRRKSSARFTRDRTKQERSNTRMQSKSPTTTTPAAAEEEEEEEEKKKDEEQEPLPVMVLATPPSPAPSKPIGSGAAEEHARYREGVDMMEKLANLSDYDDENDDQERQYVYCDLPGQEDEEAVMIDKEEEEDKGGKSDVRKQQAPTPLHSSISYWSAVFKGYPISRETMKEMHLLQ